MTNWWNVPGKTCVAAYRFIGVASQVISYTNLANPGTYDVVPVNSPLWDNATGLTFDGVTQYLTTGICINSGWSVLVRFSMGSAYDGALLGSHDGGNRKLAIFPRWTDTLAYYQNGGESSKANGITSGVLAVAGNKAYRNGITEGITIPSWSGGASTIDIHIGQRNIVGDKKNNYPISASIQAVAVYSDTLTAGEVNTCSTTMAELSIWYSMDWNISSSPGRGFSEPIVCIAPQHGMSSITSTLISPTFGFGTQDSALIGPLNGLGTQVSAQIASQSGIVYPLVVLP